MSNVQDLIKAIIVGKDYQDTFSQVMADKAGDYLDKHREIIAKSMFSSKEVVDNNTDKSTE